MAEKLITNEDDERVYRLSGVIALVARIQKNAVLSHTAKPFKSVITRVVERMSIQEQDALIEAVWHLVVNAYDQWPSKAKGSEDWRRNFTALTNYYMLTLTPLYQDITLKTLAQSGDADMQSLRHGTQQHIDPTRVAQLIETGFQPINYYVTSPIRRGMQPSGQEQWESIKQMVGLPT